MGSFVDFKCNFCGYEATDIGVGHGKRSYPRLALFRCDKCKSVGSTWVGEDQRPICSMCYDEEIVLLPDNDSQLECPKCGKPAFIVAKEGAWQ